MTEPWRRARALSRVVVLFAIPSALAAAAACTTDVPRVELGPDPGPASRPSSVHGVSPCGSCVAEECRGARQACAAEASCATYLACADACPSAATGNIDPACEGACSRPRDPAGARALAAFTSCRTSGDGASCAACGPQSALYRTPLLRQVCPAPPPPQPQRNLCPEDYPEVLARCFDCSWERCCESRVACEGSSECAAFRACTQQCGNASQVFDQCGVEHPAGFEQNAPFQACMQVRCVDSCLNPGVTVDPCSRCLITRCGDEDAAFSSTSDGILLRKCVARCTAAEPGCINACNAKYPSVREESAALYLCVDERCSFECGGE